MSRLQRMARFLGRALLRAVLPLAALLVVLRLWPHAPLADQLPLSTAIYARDGQLMRLALASDDHYRLWTPLAQVAPELVDSVVLYEDRWFWRHPGVDPLALVRSAWRTGTGQRRQGGSTLTMQLARRLYGIDSRNIGGKLQQIAGALWLEARHGKREILEAYLNTAPYGGNIEGVGAAALIYFRKPAARLTMPEALTLAVIPQNPNRRIAERGHNEQLAAARALLWARWEARAPQRARRHAPEALLALPAEGRAALPFEAPHLSAMLLAREAGRREIHSTVDLPMQHTLERVLKEYLRSRAEVGLNNAAALLLDAQTMEVRAVVGSADWNDAAIEGQVNGTLARRSPGSTLKPFIYALALDQGLLHPKTVLKDAPTSFGPFTPENFDNRFVGPVTAQDALIRSRNIPAVSVAARLTQPDLYGFLQLNHVSRLAAREHYGLALVLGGGELTMEELARLYAVVANDGLARPLAYTREQAQEQAAQEPQRLLSPASAWVTLDMLRQSPRPDTQSPARPAVAWKTGTSWGFRDAWTAGVFGRHVLVVWIGRFDGASNPAFIGIDAAAPLFLRMVDALRAQRLDGGEVARRQPADLQRVEVCAATGDLPDALCPVRTHTWFIAGKSPFKPSRLHRAVWVDATSGRRLCGAMAAQQPHARRIVVEQWGSEMRRVFAQGGLARRDFAAEAPAGASQATEADDCAAQEMVAADAPAISSPLRGAAYVLRNSRPQTLALRADAAAGVRTLYWYADASLLGQTAPGVALAWLPPRAGRYQLRVVDDQGRADVRQLDVELEP
jgi:penicillin-binding protein 1C